MIDLKSLLVFARVADSLSFSEASRSLGMPVSTVSRRVAELEQQLGTSLLQRSTRKLRLTALGREVLELARRTEEITLSVGEIASTYRADAGGTIRLAAPPSISDTILAPIVTGFQALYPAVRLDVLVTEQPVDFIAERVDLEIHVGPVSNETLVVRRVLRFRHNLVASPRYLERAGMPRHPRDLVNHRVLAFSHSEPRLVWHFEHAVRDEIEPVSLTPVLAINDYAGIVAGLIAGSGIGDLPPIIRPDLVRNGTLVTVLPDWRFPIFDLVIVSPAGRHQPRAIRLFKDFAAQAIADLFPDYALARPE